MALGNPLGKRKTQPGAGGSMLAKLRCAVEAVEDARLLFGVDSNAAVRDGENNASARGRRA
jgi:hypothetical protein